MRFPIFAIVLWLSQLYQATAIQKSLAGVVDWHTPLIGVPRADLSPSFQRIPAVNGSGVDQDVLVTVTDHNVLAMLSSVDGNISKSQVSVISLSATEGLRPFLIVWRQQFETQDAITDVKVAYDGQ